MHRALVLGVTAAVVLLGAPSPSSAAGVTRSAPFDFGTQCLTRDASAGTNVGSAGPPYGCDVVPDPEAIGGRLTTVQRGLSGSGGVIVGGTNVVGAVGHATVGKMWAATGLNVNSGAGGPMKASASASGYVCLSISYGSGSFELVRSCGQSPSVSLAASPNINYTIQVTLRDGAPNSVSTVGPCPPNVFVTCSGGGAVSSSSNSATVNSITYSIG